MDVSDYADVGGQLMSVTFDVSNDGSIDGRSVYSWDAGGRLDTVDTNGTMLVYSWT